MIDEIAEVEDGLCIALVFSCAHQANTRTEKQKAKYTVCEEQFSSVGAVRVIGEQHSGIDKANYSKNSKYGSEDSFNVHSVLFAMGLFQFAHERAS